MSLWQTSDRAVRVAFIAFGGAAAAFALRTAADAVGSVAWAYAAVVLMVVSLCVGGYAVLFMKD